MNQDSSSNITWQKMAIVIAVLTLALPAASRFVWRVVFPPNYLLYEVLPAIQTGSSLTGAIVIVNAGNAPQKDVALYLPSRSVDPNNTVVEVSAARRSSLRSLFEAEPSTPLTKYALESGARIPLGTIAPEEEVRISFVATKDKNALRPVLSLSDARAESSGTTAIEADGVRRPEFHEDLHTFYVDVAPFMLALILAMIALIVLTGFIHEVFFDTRQKKMSRLWRQMDLLQEQADKDRRYQ